MIVFPAPGSSASKNRSGVRATTLSVHGADLVRQRLHIGGGDSQHRVRQPRQHDPLRFRDQLEVARQRIERPGIADS